jgi:hypothetical protein
VLLEYYAGLGLQIQPLANFGKANAAWSTCKGNGNRTCTKLRDLLDAMIALGSSRGTFTRGSTSSRSTAARRRG